MIERSERNYEPKIWEILGSSPISQIWAIFWFAFDRSFVSFVYFSKNNRKLRFLTKIAIFQQNSISAVWFNPPKIVMVRASEQSIDPSKNKMDVSLAATKEVEVAQKVETSTLTKNRKRRKPSSPKKVVRFAVPDVVEAPAKDDQASEQTTSQKLREIIKKRGEQRAKAKKAQMEAEAKAAQKAYEQYWEQRQKERELQRTRQIARRAEARSNYRQIMDHAKNGESLFRHLVMALDNDMFSP